MTICSIVLQGSEFWTYGSVNISKSVLLVRDVSGMFDRNSNGCRKKAILCWKLWFREKFASTCLQCFNVARDMSEGHDVSCLDSCVLREIIYSDIW